MPIGPQDSQLSVTLALPAANANNTTGVIDLQAIAPNSDAWRLGRICAIVPLLVNHTDPTKTITLEIKVASASLTTSPAAPALPVAGSFATANPRQIGGVPGLATTGSLATTLYFTIPCDANGNTLQFVEFLQSVPASDGDNTASSIVYTWVAA